MNIEIEVKVKINNPDELRKNLLNYGKLEKSIRQIDEYYIPCHRDFFARKPHPIEWLRIRTNPDKVIFEYDKSVNKKANGEQEYAEEYETEISNPEEFRKILDFLNFKRVIIIDKKREYWNCGDLEVVLDDVKDLGYFIEVETKANFENTKEGKEACFEFLRMLGIKNAKDIHIKKGYPVLLLEKNSKIKK